MKKTIVIFFCFFVFSQAQAQISFNPGVRAGANISNISIIQSDYKPSFYFGFQGSLNFTKFYTIQPELIFSEQGARNAVFYERKGYGQGAQKNEIKNLAIQYLGVNFINKFNFGDFNLQFGTGLDSALNPKGFVYNSIDLTVHFGAGYLITENLGVELRFKKGLINTVNSTEYYNYSILGDATNNVFQIGAYYQFKISK